MRLTKRIFKSDFVQFLLSKLAYIYIKFVLFTSKVKYIFHDFDFKEYEYKQCIYATWHGRVIITPLKLPTKLTSYGLVSDHKDGRFIGEILNQSGISLIFGSSNRRPLAALKEILQVIKKGHNFLITPDGPRGPARKIGGAIINIASSTGLPIIPSSCSCSSAKFFNSWDNFMFPLPFSKISIIFGKPIKVPENISDKEHYKEILRQSLDEITNIADKDVNISII